MQKNWKSQMAHLWNGPSKLGEKLGWNWLIYNPGVFLEIALVARRNSGPFAASLTKVIPAAKRYCDIGAGAGQYVQALRKLGKQAVGFEYSAVGRAFARLTSTDLGSFDLNCSPSLKPIPNSCDLVFSIEVGEHIPKHLSGKFVKTLTETAPLVVITCAQPGQGGHGHINCQPKQYWVDLFHTCGFIHNEEYYTGLFSELSSHSELSSFITRNLMVFSSTTDVEINE